MPASCAPTSPFPSAECQAVPGQCSGRALNLSPCVSLWSKAVKKCASLLARQAESGASVTQERVATREGRALDP